MLDAKKKELKPLVPPDKKRCQAEVPSGNSFMTLGGRIGLERCRKKPAYIAHEKKPGADGRQGSMSLCAECAEVFKKQMGEDYAELRPINLTKLTEPQQTLLVESAKKHGAYAVNHYPPVRTLLKLGFIDDGSEGKGTTFSSYWFITERGKQWLRMKGLLSD